MGYEKTWETMVSEFDDQWSATPISWPNVDFTPPDPPAPFVKFNPIPGEAVKKELGRNGIIRHPGVLTIGVNVPTGQGEHDARQHADSILAIFEENDYGSSPALVFKQGWITPNGRSSDGSWYEINAHIPYEWDESPA